MEQKKNFFNDFIGVEELMMLKKERSELEKKERQLTIPAITDFSLIPTVYKWYKEMTSNSSMDKRHKVLWQQKFIFVSVCLFAPCTFVSGRIKRGLREELASILHRNNYPNYISKLFEIIKFHYFHDSTIREELNDIYNRILQKYKDL